MNHNQQENQPAPGGGKPKNPRNVPSQTERQAQRERAERAERAVSQDSGSRQAEATGTGGGDARVQQQANADARDPRSEQASARFDDARAGANPARESEGGNQHPKRDLPGTD